MAYEMDRNRWRRMISENLLHTMNQGSQSLYICGAVCLGHELRSITLRYMLRLCSLLGVIWGISCGHF